MKFIERGVNRRGDKSQSGSAPEVVLAVTERAIKERRQDRVLGEVGAFPHEQLDRLNGRSGNIGSDPAQEGTNEERRVFGGHQIGRADENKNHPEQDRQPVFQKPTHQKRNHNRAACANFAA